MKNVNKSCPNLVVILHDETLNTDEVKNKNSISLNEFDFFLYED